MKEVILSADNTAKLYRVPDAVADNLEKTCLEFSVNWIWKNPNGAKLLHESYDHQYKYASFTEKDFIEYLNEWIYPDQPSVLLRDFGCDYSKLPKEYKKIPKYLF